jgi:uncharacterized LabA/DUF88 family protein
MGNGKQPERVAIFIDGSNFYHSVRDSFGFHDNEIDFSRLIEILKDGRLLTSTYYYNAPLDRGYNMDTYRRQQRFFSELRNIPGFHVVLCRMRKIKNDKGKTEYAVKGDDVHLATDLVSLAYENAYDAAIVVSGDGDFAPAIQKVQKLGKNVENAFFAVSSSSFLKQICNRSIRLDDYVHECLRKKN